MTRAAPLLLAVLVACGSAATPRAAPDGGSSDPAGDAAARAVWSPPPGTTWQWQLDGAIDTSVDAAMYDVDLFETPDDVIDALHGAGRTVICYFSAGSRENWRPDADSFPEGALGKPLDGWQGERWIDIRDPAIRAIMTARLDLAVAKKCDGVEPDNVDAFVNPSGFPLTGADQLDYDRFLADAAHARDLSAGLKNDIDQVADLLDAFDWALDEECVRYRECGALAPFIDAGKAVFHVEYGDASAASAVCPETAPLRFSSLIKHIRLDSWRLACP